MTNSNENSANKLSRRDFLERTRAMGFGAAGAMLAQSLVFPIDAFAADVAVTFFLFSGGEQGTVAKEVVNKFLAENKGVTVEFYESSNAVAYPKILAARNANPNKPLVNFGYFNVGVTNQGDADGMWDTLDPTKIPNMNLVYPAYRRPGDRGIGNSVSLIGIAYNSQYVKTAPTSWADVWSNPQYKGKVVLFDYLWPYTTVIQAAMMNGGSIDKPDAGFEIWSKHTDQIMALVTSTQQAQNLLARGDAWITVWSKGNVQQWKDAGAPIEFAIPKEGAVAFPLFFQIILGNTPEQKAVAEKILNILLSPESLARWCDLNGLAPAAKGVSLPARMANDPAYKPETIEKAIQLDWATLAKVDAMYREKWDRMVKSKL